MAIEIAGLADIVRIHGRRQPDVAALVHDGRTTTYAELDRAVTLHPVMERFLCQDMTSAVSFADSGAALDEVVGE